MNYTYTQLTRVSPGEYRRHVWHARAKRLWHRYLRAAAAIAGVFGNTLLRVIYFVALPPFVWFARRAERHEPAGFIPIEPTRGERSPRSQY